MNKRYSDETSAANIGKLVKASTKKAVFKKMTSRQFDKNKTTATAQGKTPNATDVRDALKGGHITPLEASSLNPRGGLNPKLGDVKDALNGGHITVEETEILLGRKANRPPVK
jgi:hypothetical protein